jgi:hypothetical protein
MHHSMKMSCSLMAALVTAIVLLEADAPEHPRLKLQKPDGRREKLSMGTLFLPEKLPTKGKVNLLVHFHGPEWIAEVAGARAGLAVLSIQLGSGSAVYGKPFTDAKLFADLLADAEKKSGRSFDSVGLSGWSAGYGAIRAILRHKEHYRRVQWVVLLDSPHAGHRPGKPAPQLVTADLDVYIRLARDAAAGRKRFLISHSQIVPTGYASTTECADYVIAQAGLFREKKVGKGPFGLPRLSEASKGGLLVVGCAGSTAADHVDHMHALPELLEAALKH